MNIVTESILIQHPEGKQKKNRANKRKRRKAIATEATTSKKKNVSDPQMAKDKTCSSPQEQVCEMILPLTNSTMRHRI